MNVMQLIIRLIHKQQQSTIDCCQSQFITRLIYKQQQSTLIAIKSNAAYYQADP